MSVSATAPRGFRRTRRDPLDTPLKVAFPLWILGSVLLVIFPLYLLFMVSFAPGCVRVRPPDSPSGQSEWPVVAPQGADGSRLA